MAAISHLGSGTQSSKPGTQDGSKAITEANKLIPENHTSPMLNANRYTVPDDGVFADSHIMKDVTHNATTFNTDRYPDALHDTFIYPEGHSIAVTYFNLQTASLIDRTTPVDPISGALHPSHKSYLQINGFEIFLDKEIEFTTSTSSDGSETSCEGSATTLPGFEPIKGDMFYLRLRSGHVGLMAVRDVERLGSTTATTHRIVFTLMEYLTPEKQQMIQNQVSNVAYYDRVNYLTNKFTLLKHDTYLLLKQFNQLRKEMSDWYMYTYWDQVMSTIMHPEGYYDPYVVAYMQQKISLVDTNRRPKQLYSRLYDFESSIWYPLVQSNRPFMDTATCKWRLRLFKPSYWNTDLTSLVGKSFVALGDMDKKDIDHALPYQPPLPDIIQTTPYGGRTEYFYSGDTARMSVLEYHTHCSVVSEIDPFKVYPLVNDYRKWDVVKAFYDIPLAIALVDTSIYQLGGK